MDTRTDLSFLESVLAPGVRLVMSTRRGGVSEGAYGSLNLSLSVGDDPDRVAENRRRLLERARLSPPARVRQIHGRDVLEARASGEAGVADGLVTAVVGLPIACLVADCAPVVAADAGAGIVGIAHAGWRGAAGGIVASLLEALGRRGARPERLDAAVLPSIGPCCLEVGEEVASLFPAEYLRPGPGKPRLDLWGALRAQLAQAGVDPSRIHVWDLCTRCRDDLFYSYRRDGRTSGRMLAAVVRDA